MTLDDIYNQYNQQNQGTPSLDDIYNHYNGQTPQLNLGSVPQADTAPVDKTSRLASVGNFFTDPFSQIGGGVENAIRAGGRAIGMDTPAQPYVPSVFGGQTNPVGYRNGVELGPTDTAVQGAGDLIAAGSNFLTPEMAGLAKYGIFGRILKGAAIGGTIGGAQGFGTTLADTGDVNQAIGSGIVGATTGAATGGITGPVLDKILTKVNPDRVVAPIVNNRPNDLTTIEGSSAQLRKIGAAASSRNINVKDVLANTDLLQGSVDNTGTIRTLQPDGAVSQINDFIKPAEGVVINNLKKEGATLTPDEITGYINKAIDNSSIKGADVKTAKDAAQNEIDYLKEKYPSGDITLSELQELKIYKGSQNKYLNPSKDVQDKAITSGIKQAIEDNTHSIDVQKTNEELAKF